MFNSASPKASEYHLIDLAIGVSHGGFETLTGLANALAKKVWRPGTFSMATIVLYDDPR